eukprot:TRINITY_DN8768_c0_g1_i2.p1 TRINITY_DN8768_c0_g1~~TRINITY_DN8768_c0_g1_i2.p1  ORF type:complete len:171 (+),score=44.47 TRINITY_DN8768_c0_g1_i2:27-539(+)
MGDTDFANRLNAILKVQLEENRENESNPSHSATPYIKKTNVGSKSLQDDGGEWTHYLSLKVQNFKPLGQLLDNINNVQDEMINELGTGVVNKTAEGNDLHIKLIAFKETLPSALTVSLRSLSSLPIVSTPAVDFGGVLATKEGVSIALFSEPLEDVVNHIVNHTSKTPGK